MPKFRVPVLSALVLYLATRTVPWLVLYSPTPRFRCSHLAHLREFGLGATLHDSPPRNNSLHHNLA